MKYTRAALIEQYNTAEKLQKKLKFLFFWGHSINDTVITKACLSQWYPVGFVVDGQQYLTAEHWMMAKKAELFEDQTILTQILAAATPGEAKKLGRMVRNFDAAIWDKWKGELVIMGSWLKFQQNPALKTFLQQTYQRILVEASPVDKIWGIGMVENQRDVGDPYAWKGENLLGFALMEARDYLDQVWEDQEYSYLPPWKTYPDLDRYSLGWRMGEGEAYVDEFRIFWESLTEFDQRLYQTRYLATGEWEGWYKDALNAS